MPVFLVCFPMNMTTDMKNPERTSSFDSVKAVAAYLVIFLHWETENLVGRSIHLLAYVAVPLFFMISGYFFLRLKERGRVVGQLKKVVWLTLYAYFFYFIFYWVRHQNVDSLSDWLIARRLSLYILACDVRLGFHLWYLNSIIFILELVYLFTKKYDVRRLYYLIPVLFVLNWWLSSKDVEQEYNHNILIPGVSFFLLGSWMSVHTLRYRKWFVFLPLLFLFMLIGELFFTEWLGIGRMFVCLVPLCFSVVLLAIHHPALGAKTILPYIGRKLSAYIYVYHVAFLFLFYDCMSRPLAHSFLLPVLTAVCSMGVAWLHVKAKELITRTWHRSSAS